MLYEEEGHDSLLLSGLSGLRRQREKPGEAMPKYNGTLVNMLQVLKEGVRFLTPLVALSCGRK